VLVFVVFELFVEYLNFIFYTIMAANVDWAIPAEEQEKLITKVDSIDLSKIDPIPEGSNEN
jgi:hypothetical protein